MWLRKLDYALRYVALFTYAKCDIIISINPRILLAFSLKKYYSLRKYLKSDSWDECYFNHHHNII